MFAGKKQIEAVFQALSEQLAEKEVDELEMVVCGGAALNVLGFVKRTTQDVDVIAFVKKDKQGNILLTKAEPLPSDLLEAAERVGRDFNLPENWRKLHFGACLMIPLKVIDWS
ncbi:MAG TPA: hypothetical protein ENI06_10325 [Spirochaetales bacterium]|nr:hypothetical protein [Spirochaetales bacterium]